MEATALRRGRTRTQSMQSGTFTRGCCPTPAPLARLAPLAGGRLRWSCRQCCMSGIHFLRSRMIASRRRVELADEFAVLHTDWHPHITIATRDAEVRPYLAHSVVQHWRERGSKAVELKLGTTVVAEARVFGLMMDRLSWFDTVMLASASPRLDARRAKARASRSASPAPILYSQHQPPCMHTQCVGLQAVPSQSQVVSRRDANPSKHQDHTFDTLLKRCHSSHNLHTSFKHGAERVRLRRADELIPMNKKNWLNRTLDSR
ncbi:hypothetical protein L1887_62066 [Cichorium endivia]|nr:hypothetical protein L1887_62066 [Cichorium endivia]